MLNKSTETTYTHIVSCTCDYTYIPTKEKHIVCWQRGRSSFYNCFSFVGFYFMTCLLLYRVTAWFVLAVSIQCNGLICESRISSHWSWGHWRWYHHTLETSATSHPLTRCCDPRERKTSSSRLPEQNCSRHDSTQTVLMYVTCTRFVGSATCRWWKGWYFII